MTSIKLTLSGAVAQTETDGIITEGMKGLPVTIVYDEQWDGLYKTLVCKSAAAFISSGTTPSTQQAM